MNVCEKIIHDEELRISREKFWFMRAFVFGIVFSLGCLLAAMIKASAS